MAEGSIAVFVNPQSMGRALAQARKECEQDKRSLNAVNRAARNLEPCMWQFDGHTWLVKSAMESIHYTLTADGCECKAFLANRPCWHRAARRLLCKAAELAQIPAPRDMCPMCGAIIEAVCYAINGRSYTYYEVCSGDGVHITKVVMPGSKTQEASHAQR